MLAIGLLLAVLAGDPLVGAEYSAPVARVAYNPEACDIVREYGATASPDDVNAMIRRFVDIVDLAEAGDEEAALGQSVKAGHAVAAFRDARAMERLYEVSERILASYDERQLHQVFVKTLRAAMDPTAHPERITDTRRIRVLKTTLDHPQTVGSRSVVDTRIYLEYRLDAAGICESRKIFLNIALADGYRFRSDDNPELYFQALEKRVNRLSGLDVDGRPLKWFGFSELTRVAMRYGDFEAAWRFLKRTEAEAETARATMNLDERSLEDLETVMEWLGPYFLQERMEHACPDEHYIDRVPCILREHYRR